MGEKKMKRIAVMIVGMLLTTSLVGCGHKHTWKEATCETPRICTECGETEGEPIGHNYTEATCESPRICVNCGQSEGEALGHNYASATCESPKTCAVCGKTEGVRLEHSFASATLDAPKTCILCGKTDGKPLEIRELDLSFISDGDYFYFTKNSIIAVCHNDNNSIIDIQLCDYEGNVVFEQKHDITTDSNVGHDHIGYSYGFSKDIFFYACGDGTKCTINIYDYDNNLLLEKELGEGYFTEGGNQFGLYNVNYGGFYRIDNIKSGETVVYFDDNNKKECSEEDYYGAIEKMGITLDWDRDKLAYCTYQEAIDGYYICYSDGTGNGYVDKEFNEIALFNKASGIASNGYSFASNDGESYELLDKDFNVIGENMFSGKTVSGKSLYANVFTVKSGDSVSYILVE